MSRLSISGNDNIVRANVSSVADTGVTKIDLTGSQNRVDAVISVAQNVDHGFRVSGDDNVCTVRTVFGDVSGVIDSGDNSFTNAVVLPYSKPGDVAVVTGALLYPWTQGGESQVLDVTLKAGTAPVGADLIVDLLSDESGSLQSLWAVAGDRPSISDGSSSVTRTVPDGSRSRLTKDDLLRLDIAQVGSTTPGADLMVVVRILAM